MKQLFVIVVSLTLIVNSQCGLIDGLLGTVKDTTSSITHGIGGALHQGKTFVFGSSETNATGHAVYKPGLIGTISLKIHDVSAAVREEIRTVFSMFDSQEHGKGIIGRFLEKVKCRVFKIKNFLHVNSVGHIENKPNAPIKLGNDTAVLCDALKKYFFKNNTSGVSGIRQTLNSLHGSINKIRNNITKNRQDNGNGEEDGAGLIDIRTSVNNVDGGLQDDFENGIDAGYDKIEDGIEENRGNVKDLRNTFKQNTHNFIENQRRNGQNNLDRMGYNANKFTSNVENSISDVGIRFKDESDKVKDLMENSYKKLDFDSARNWGRA